MTSRATARAPAALVPSVRPAKNAARLRHRADCRRRVAVAAQATRELPAGLKKIVGAFQMVPDPMSRYKQLLFFASKLQGLDPSLKIEANQVKVRATPPPLAAHPNFGL
jgi:BolA-like protein 1